MPLKNKTGQEPDCKPCLAPCKPSGLANFQQAFFFYWLPKSFFIPAVFIFLNQHPGEHFLYALFGIFLTDIGICTCGSLLGALCTGQSGKESLLSIILFPLLIPLLLSAISLCSAGLLDLHNPPVQTARIIQWIGITLAFDFIFSAASLLLFPYLYHGE